MPAQGARPLAGRFSA